MTVWYRRSRAVDYRCVCVREREREREREGESVCLCVCVCVRACVWKNSGPDWASRTAASTIKATTGLAVRSWAPIQRCERERASRYQGFLLAEGGDVRETQRFINGSCTRTQRWRLKPFWKCYREGGLFTDCSSHKNCPIWWFHSVLISNTSHWQKYIS